MLVAEKLLILPFCKYTKFVLQNIRISFRQLLKGILLLTLLLTAGNRHAIAQEPDSLLARKINRNGSAFIRRIMKKEL